MLQEYSLNFTFSPFSAARTLTPIIWSSKVSPGGAPERSGGLSSHLTSLGAPASMESSQALTDPSRRPEMRSCREGHNIFCKLNTGSRCIYSNFSVRETMKPALGAPENTHASFLDPSATSTS